MKPLALGLVLGAALLALPIAGCTQRNVGSLLGLEKRSPDEFQVVRRAPLELPPDDSLPPPRPGAARPQETPAAVGARAALLGSDPTGATASATPGTGETALVASAGPAAEPGIRRRVEEEGGGNALTSRFLFGDPLGLWDRFAVPGEPLDPEAEAARLNQAGAAGGRPTLIAAPPVQINQPTDTPQPETRTQ